MQLRAYCFYSSDMNMTNQYKFTYFDIRGRGESIRLLFALAKVKYEDTRVSDTEWPNVKPKSPWGQMPFLQVGGVTIAQTGTIARFLARRFKLAGSNEFEVTKCEELVDAATDLGNEQIKHMLEQDATKAESLRKHLMEISIPNYFHKFDYIQASNGGDFMVGKIVSWADLWIANVVQRLDDRFGKDINWKLYPNLKNMKDAFFAIPQIKEYVDVRPQSDM